MLDTTALRTALKAIYQVDDKYLVPMDAGWYVPTYDKTNKVGTWIGYRIMSVKPTVRTFRDSEDGYSKSVKIKFRLSFIGTQAEELALQTLLFDDRIDVKEAFEKSQTQLNYISREIQTYPVREGGLNDSLVWYVDIECQSFYWHDITYGEWGVETHPAEMWLPSQLRSSGKEVLQGGTMSIKV